jgi:hypothetical protein
MNEKEFLEMCRKYLRVTAHKVSCPDEASDMLQICLRLQSQERNTYTSELISYTEVELPYGVRWE